MRLSEPTTKLWMKIDPHYQQQKCKPMTLVSGGISFMQIFAEVPRGGGVKRDWGCWHRQFSAFSMAIFSDTLEMRPASLYSDMLSVVGFSVIPKCVTLNDLDWLFRVKFCFRAGLASWDRATSENNCVKSYKDKTHTVSSASAWQGLYSFWQCKVCADIRSGSLERRR